MSAHARIRRAQLARERSLLREVKQANRRGERWHVPIGLLSLAGHHALDRLESKGLVRFVRPRRGFGLGGYVAAATPIGGAQ